MITACYFKLGTIAMDAGSVMDCVIYENLGYFPWGKIIFRDKIGMVQANFDFRTYTDIEISMGVYEDPLNVSQIVFNAEVVSSSVTSDPSDNSISIVELIFIGRGTNGKLMNSIPSVAYQNQSSIEVIKDVCKKLGVTLNIDSKLKTSDNMDWLLVHHTVLTALTFLCDRSHIDNSALLYSISLDGSVSVYSIKDKFSDTEKCTFMVAPKSYTTAAMNNGKFKINNKPVIYFNQKASSNQSGLNVEASQVTLKEVIVDPKKNKVISSAKSIKAKGEGGSDGKGNIVIYQPSKSPQVHDKYAISPIYRKAVIASYAYSLDITCENETFTKSGDVIDVLDGVYDPSTNKFSKVYKTSGKYLVLRKGYHFMQGSWQGASSFKTTLHLIGDNQPTTDKQSEAIRESFGM